MDILHFLSLSLSFCWEKIIKITWRLWCAWKQQHPDLKMPINHLQRAAKPFSPNQQKGWTSPSWNHFYAWNVLQPATVVCKLHNWPVVFAIWNTKQRTKHKVQNLSPLMSTEQRRAFCRSNVKTSNQITYQ